MRLAPGRSGAIADDLLRATACLSFDVVGGAVTTEQRAPERPLRIDRRAPNLERVVALRFFTGGDARERLHEILIGVGLHERRRARLAFVRGELPYESLTGDHVRAFDVHASHPEAAAVRATQHASRLSERARELEMPRDDSGARVVAVPTIAAITAVAGAAVAAEDGTATGVVVSVMSGVEREAAVEEGEAAVE